MGHEKIIELMKQAAILLNNQDRYDRISSMKAHIVGLQGEKRVDRIEHREYGGTVDYLMHRLLDLFDVEFYPPENRINLDGITDITKYLETHIAQLWKFHSELAMLSNEMTLAGHKKIAKCLDKHVFDVEDKLVELRRLYKEYLLANKEYHHISRYEVGYFNVHDEAEKIEGK